VESDEGPVGAGVGAPASATWAGVRLVWLPEEMRWRRDCASESGSGAKAVPIERRNMRVCRRRIRDIEVGR
jgi:hypothetical protein